MSARVVELHKRRLALEAEIFAAVTEDYPPGATITWFGFVHEGGICSGTVVENDGKRLRVRRHVRGYERTIQSTRIMA